MLSDTLADQVAAESRQDAFLSIFRECPEEYREMLMDALWQEFCRFCYCPLNGSQCYCWNDE